MEMNEPKGTAMADYLKDGETPAECVRRNRNDVDNLLGHLTNITRDRDALLKENDQAREIIREQHEDIVDLAAHVWEMRMYLAGHVDLSEDMLAFWHDDPLAGLDNATQIMKGSKE